MRRALPYAIVSALLLAALAVLTKPADRPCAPGDTGAVRFTMCDGY